MLYTIASAGGPGGKCGHAGHCTWSGHNCSHGEAIPNPFSHGDNIRQYIMALEAPEVRAQPSKSCLHLEIDEKITRKLFQTLFYSLPLPPSHLSLAFWILAVL